MGTISPYTAMIPESIHGQVMASCRPPRRAILGNISW